MKWSLKNMQPIDKKIELIVGKENMKAPNGKVPNAITLGIPGMGQAKKLIREYYLGK